MSALRRLTLAALALLTSAGAPAAAPAQIADADRALIEAVGIEQRIGERLPLDARFTDHAGRSVALGDVIGDKPTVLALVYYECPMLCNLVLNGLTSTLRGVALELGRDFRVVAVGIDPDETWDLAGAKRDGYAAELGGGDGLTFLVGAEPEIRRVADAVGFRYAYDAERDEYAHGAMIAVVTPDGVLARYFYGVEYPPRDLRLALVEASDGKVGSIVDQALLLCFHYDPTRGRYGFAILNAIRIAGGATLLVLSCFVGRHLLHDRRRRAHPAAEEGL